MTTSSPTTSPDVSLSVVATTDERVSSAANSGVYASIQFAKEDDFHSQCPDLLDFIKTAYNNPATVESDPALKRGVAEAELKFSTRCKSCVDPSKLFKQEGSVFSCTSAPKNIEKPFAEKIKDFFKDNSDKFKITGAVIAALFVMVLLWRWSGKK